MDANNVLVKGLALGLYNAAMSATMTGPFYMAITGKNIYGQQASAEEIEGAIIGLATFAASMVIVPVAIDTAAGTAANELSGLGNRTSTPGTPVVGSQPRNLPEGNPVQLNDARLVQAKLDVASNGFKAIGQGIPNEAITTLLDKAFSDADTAVKAGDPQTALNILNDANLQIADQAFAVKHPGAKLISEPGQINLINSVKTKAALEAQGKPQTWNEGRGRQATRDECRPKSQ